VTFLHLLALALGIVGAVAGSDVLGHRGIGPWPIGLLALLLVPVAGWLYSPWVAAIALGLALGTAVVRIASWRTAFRDRRQARRDQARHTADARSRQLDEAPASHR
jgi:membrane protein implicated in regulation of membrane protease activity